jgi:protein SCO1/2
MNAYERKFSCFMRVHLRAFAAAFAVFSFAWLPQSALGQQHTPAPISTETTGEQGFDNTVALKISQAAIGTRLDDYGFTNSSQETVHLADFRGKPLVISLVYSSCYHTCPMTTQHLAQAVRAARQALGADSFTVLTIGFDTPNDTPQAMADFARHQNIPPFHWQFLSADAATMQRLIKDLGFIYRPSPKGFDHLIQASVIDADGKLYRQVYGELFEIPWLVEPLKQLQYGRRVDDSAWIDLVKKVRLFCTTYDPASGMYRVDYSLFVGIAIGLMVIGGAVIFLVRSMRGPKLS